jgi:hypothetical protein
MTGYAADRYDGLVATPTSAGARFRLRRHVRLFAIFIAALLGASLATIIVIALVMYAEVDRRLYRLRRP